MSLVAMCQMSSHTSPRLPTLRSNKERALLVKLTGLRVDIMVEVDVWGDLHF